jgi:uncharacterized protein (TIGR00369 family)
MSANDHSAFALLRGEMEGPPFHHFIKPQPIEADSGRGTATIALEFRDELARAPGDLSFHGGVIASLIDMAGHAAVAITIRRMAPTIDLRIDYLRPAKSARVTAHARLLKAGRTVARVDIDVTDAEGRLVAVGRGSFSTA